VETINKFVANLIGGFLLFNDPGAVELKGAVPEPRDSYARGTCWMMGKSMETGNR
jgi:hypothetical protein